MRPKPISYLLLLIVVALSACGSTGVITEMVSSTPEPTTPIVTPTPTNTPTLSATPLPSSTTIPPTATFTSTVTPTSTPLPTMKPEQAEETIRTLLQEPVDCPAPCFWGITPGETTLDEAKLAFAHLGLQPIFTTTEDNKEFYDVIYEFESGLSVSPLLTIQDQIVENLTVHITPEKSQPGVPREWLAYSPETLIARYGPPSKVEFFLGRAAPTPVSSMVIYFDAVDLIIEYSGIEIFTPVTSLRICPPAARFWHVRVWMGEHPEYPPLKGVPLEEATSMTLEEFAELMLGDPEDACFELNAEAFP